MALCKYTGFRQLRGAPTSITLATSFARAPELLLRLKSVLRDAPDGVRGHTVGSSTYQFLNRVFCPTRESTSDPRLRSTKIFDLNVRDRKNSFAHVRWRAAA